MAADVARLNPMSYGIAGRHFTFAEPVGTSAALAVGISVLVATTAAAIAIRGFRRPFDGRTARIRKGAGHSRSRSTCLPGGARFPPVTRPSTPALVP